MYTVAEAFPLLTDDFPPEPPPSILQPPPPPSPLPPGEWSAHDVSIGLNMLPRTPEPPAPPPEPPALPGEDYRPVVEAVLTMTQNVTDVGVAAAAYALAAYLGVAHERVRVLAWPLERTSLTVIIDCGATSPVRDTWHSKSPCLNHTWPSTRALRPIRGLQNARSALPLTPLNPRLPPRVRIRAASLSTMLKQ